MSNVQSDSPIRVLIVEDSRAQRELLVGLLRAHPRFVVAGTASNGQEAIDATLRLRPDVIAMDIHLPGIDGYEATRQIMQRCPTPIVMISSSNAERRSVEALAAGAVAVVRKPSGVRGKWGEEDQTNFLTTLRLMAGVRVVTRHPPRAPLQAQSVQQPKAGLAHVLAIAASTGGPAAVQTLLQGLDRHYPLPILLVQHIARGFTTAMSDWLNQTVPLPVRIAARGDHMRPGHVYLAPDDHHICIVERNIISLRPSQPHDRYCPSADVLFESVAKAYGGQAIGLIMTGMGDDGARGLAQLRQVGGITLAQDEASCVVYGMPRAAVDRGAVMRIESLSNLAGVIMDLSGGGLASTTA